MPSPIYILKNPNNHYPPNFKYLITLTQRRILKITLGTITDQWKSAIEEEFRNFGARLFVDLRRKLFVLRVSKEWESKPKFCTFVLKILKNWIEERGDDLVGRISRWLFQLKNIISARLKEGISRARFSYLLIV